MVHIILLGLTWNLVVDTDDMMWYYNKDVRPVAVMGVCVCVCLNDRKFGFQTSKGVKCTHTHT